MPNDEPISEDEKEIKEKLEEKLEEIEEAIEEAETPEELDQIASDYERVIEWAKLELKGPMDQIQTELAAMKAELAKARRQMAKAPPVTPEPEAEAEPEPIAEKVMPPEPEKRETPARRAITRL